MRAHSSLHQLRSVEAAGGWLLAIARNEVARWCNKWGHLQATDFELLSESQHEKRLEDHEWIHQSIQQLSWEFRQVVMMYYFEHKSYAEIAQELELPIGTVMSRLNRARRHLKETLVALMDSKASKEAGDLTQTEAAK